MRTHSKLLLTALTAAFVLAAAIGTASAGRFSTSEQRFRVTWSRLTLSGFATNVQCEVTLEGSYHYRTFVKVAESLVGHITGVTVRHPCTGGEAWAYNGTERLGVTTLSNSLPWHVRYQSFNGTLPNITAIVQSLVGSRFLVEATFLGIRVRCNYTTEAVQSARGPVTREVETRTLEQQTAEGEISSESGGCPRGRFSGAGPVRTPGGGLITVTLI
jgi:hypothetical protein